MIFQDAPWRDLCYDSRMITTSDSSVRSRGTLITVNPPRAGKNQIGIDREKLAPPKTRGLRFIPSEDTLQDLIARALEALRAGIFWDRGSILNIVV